MNIIINIFYIKINIITFYNTIRHISNIDTLSKHLFDKQIYRIIHKINKLIILKYFVFDVK